MECSDETGVMQRIQSSFGNCSSSNPKQINHNSHMSINGQIQNLSLEGVTSNSNTHKRPIGIPPSHPHLNSPKMASQHMGTQNFGHSRSLSQPSFFSFDNLPPLSPSSIVPDPVLSDLPKNEQANKHLHGPGPFAGGNAVHVTEGLPPRRGHKRSNSDIPMRFSSVVQQSMPLFTPPIDKDKPVQLVLKRESECGGIVSEGTEVDELFSAYMNLDSFDALNSSSVEDKDMDSKVSGGTRTNDSSENEVESGISGNSYGKRHVRSLSMDSFMGSLNFNEELLKPPPSPGIRSAHHSPSSSFDGNNGKFSLEFGNGEFSAEELKKIMTNEKLAEIAMADPKRAKRILANRQSAARSKERKLRYIAELEHKVQLLQTEATTLSAQLTLLQRDSAGITSENKELRLRLQAMEQQAHLRDALNEALAAEVQRLRLAAGELRGDAPPPCFPQQLIAANNQKLQMQSFQFKAYQLQQQQDSLKQHQTQPDAEAPKS